MLTEETARVKRNRERNFIRIGYMILAILKVNKSFCELLNGEGIKCRIFNNVNPALRVFMNNRDHRKLTIIDGVVGFTGGYNLSDEYFNLTHPFGEWKDTGVIVRGNAVQSMTAQYLEMWNLMQPEQDTWETLAPFFVSSPEEPDAKGIIQPYADSPLDEEHVGENVYLNMIHASEHYIYFMTPYLIIPDEFSHALQLAAKRAWMCALSHRAYRIKRSCFRRQDPITLHWRQQVSGSSNTRQALCMRRNAWSMMWLRPAVPSILITGRSVIILKTACSLQTARRFPRSWRISIRRFRIVMKSQKSSINTAPIRFESGSAS